jgi:DNA-binding TFAR19-related protein (PDSD5 family)
MLLRVALVRTDVSEEVSASFIRVTRIGELRTTLAVSNNLQSLLEQQQRRKLKKLWPADLVDG